MESKEENINLIAGRIMDEYRKHPLLDWNIIAARKIHSQWFEYYENQNNAQFKEIELLKSDLLIAKEKLKLNYNIAISDEKLSDEIKESIKTCANGIHHLKCDIWKKAYRGCAECKFYLPLNPINNE